MATNEETNAAGTDTRPPMLVEDDYDSWKIRIQRYIRGKPNGKLIWKSIQNGPTPHPMVTDPPPTGSTIVPAPRKKLDSETLQQRKEDLFDEYERFRAIGNESIHDYFVRFHKLVNDMKITQLEIPTHQMNTKFVNNLPAYWVVSNPPTTSSDFLQTSRTLAKVHDGHIVNEPVQRKAPCKEPKRKMDSQYFKDKALLMEAKEKGDVLDAEAEAFLADVECTAPYDQPQALTITNMFQANHEDAYDSDVDEGPNAAVAFMANLSSTSATNNPVNEPSEPHLSLYDADTLLHPAHHPVRIWDSEDVLVHQVVSIEKTEIVHDKVYGLCDNEIASNTSNPATPVTPFVHNRPLKSSSVIFKRINVVFHQFEDICSIVLTSDIVVPPSLNCLCEVLRSACDREHTKVLELEAEVLKQQKMVIESEKQCFFCANAFLKLTSLRKQLQGKIDTIRNLDAQINIMKVLNVGSTVGSFDKQALETELTQLKDALTSVRIQIDGYRAENVNQKRRYEELSKSNAYSRSTFTAKINALTAENTKLKTELSGKKSSGSTASEKPKVLASGMYTNSSKYVPPPKRANWVKPTPLPKNKQVTFQEPHRTSNRPTQKPPVQQNKKPNVSVNLSTRTKPATESHKPMPKSHTRNHHILPSKSVNARRAADHNRKLHVVDHNQFVIRSLKSVNTKTPQAKHSVNHTKKVWKATRNHNVNTTKTAWRPTGKVVGSVKPQWKPTGRHFALYDNCPLTRIMEPIVEPLELTPSVSSSSKVTMISRFTDCKLSDRKAGSKGLSVISWNAEERDVVPPGYSFEYSCTSLRTVAH
ncbi:hypothetical protein Tco_1138394 [Tanacetum coccineum]